MISSLLSQFVSVQIVGERIAVRIFKEGSSDEDDENTDIQIICLKTGEIICNILQDFRLSGEDYFLLQKNRVIIVHGENISSVQFWVWKNVSVTWLGGDILNTWTKNRRWNLIQLKNVYIVGFCRLTCSKQQFSTWGTRAVHGGFGSSWQGDRIILKSTRNQLILVSTI